MAGPTIPDPSQATAEAVFAGYIDQVERGDAIEFDTVCAKHPELRTQLEQLHGDWLRLDGVFSRLGINQGLEQRLETAFGSAGTLRVALEPRAPLRAEQAVARVAGRRLGRSSSGRYRTLDEIGRGGMGTVLRVWDEELRRHLAMKVLGTGDDANPAGSFDPDLLSRFLEEAQVTGQLDHPGIVPVHELGFDADGQVFFTMKLVRGRTLLEVFELVATRSDGWSLTRALGVIQRVSEALAYAHERGVIHRDIKPANIMVGAFGEVYAMDWGLARVLTDGDEKPREGQRDDPVVLSSDRRRMTGASPDSPQLTQDGEVLGTPVYMSPEQAQGRIDEIGPGADIYSLGAVLYHLLAGRPPYSERGSSRSPHQVLHRIAREEPLPLADCPDPVPPELAAICEKGMERNPARRYPSMQAFGDDLRAFLEGRVVGAYETGAVAELKKWVRRNRGMAAALLAAVLALMAGLLFTTLAKNEADRQRLEAQEEASSRRAMARYLRDLFGVVSPRRAGREARVIDMLDQASAEIDTIFADDPRARCYLHYAVGRPYQELGDLEQAEGHLAEAERIAVELLPADEPLGLEVRAYQRFSHGDRKQAIDMVRRMVELRRDALGPRHKETLGSRFDLARMLSWDGEYDESLEIQRDVHQTWVEIGGEDHIGALRALHEVANTLSYAGRLDEAAESIAEVVDRLTRSLGEDHPELMAARASQIGIARSRSRFDEVEHALRILLELRRRVLGPEHPETLNTMNDLANLLSDLRQWDEAEQMYETLVEVGGRRLDPTHPFLLTYRNGRAELLRRSGQLDRAETEFRELLELRSKKFGRDDEGALSTATNLALTLTESKQHEQAETLYRETLQLLERKLGPAHVKTLKCRNNLASLLIATNQRVEGIGMYRSIVQVCEETNQSDLYAALVARFNLAYELFRDGEYAEAEPHLRRCRDGMARTYGERALETWTACYYLAQVLGQTGQLEEARELLEDLLSWPLTEGEFLRAVQEQLDRLPPLGDS